MVKLKLGPQTLCTPKVDKISACRFKVFYGKLLGASLIETCPVNLECTGQSRYQTLVVVIGKAFSVGNEIKG